jgi:hypothetical protein
MDRFPPISTLLVAVLAVVVGVGCGSGNATSGLSTQAGPRTRTREHTPQSSDSSTGAKPVPHKQRAPEHHSASAAGTGSHFVPPTHHDSPSGSAQFKTKGGDNSIQGYGAEGGESEFAQAAKALHGYLDARAASAWGAACSYMAPGVAESLGQLSESSDSRSCAKVLASLSAGVPAAALREAAIADVAALRVEGENGFLLFHGAHHQDYFMPMRQVAGTWKVAALAPSALF